MKKEQQIVRYEERHIEAVKRFNVRLEKSGEIWRFSEHPTSQWLPEAPDEDIFERFYVVEEGDEVRGGYILKWQPFWIEGRVENICSLYLPLSEGIIDPKYRTLGPRLIRDALSKNPYLFCLGMGGTGQPLPRVLNSMKWRVEEVPFYFLPLNASRFLTNLQPLQNTRWKRIAAKIATGSGVASAGLAVINALRTASKQVRNNLEIEPVDSFDSWADEIWEKARSEYSLCAVRKMRHQKRIYSANSSGSMRALVRKNGLIVGWFVARVRSMNKNKYFGNMRVGSIIDAMASPGLEKEVVWAARCFIHEKDADIIVCNIHHQIWRSAMGATGFFGGPSNFAVATSPELTALLESDERMADAHLMRGDGEGPTHL